MIRKVDLIFLTVCFNIFILSSDAQTYPSANQNKTIKRLTTYVSSFITFAQYQTLCNKVSAGMLAGTPFATVKSDVTNTLISGMSASQYSSVLMKGTTLLFSLGASGITTAITKLGTVIGNNLNPVYNQMLAYAVTLRAQGLQDKGIAKNGYRIVNSFASKKRIKTIFTRVSLQFTTSQWNSIKSALNGILAFTKNGF